MSFSGGPPCWSGRICDIEYPYRQTDSNQFSRRRLAENAGTRPSEFIVETRTRGKDHRDGKAIRSLREVPWRQRDTATSVVMRFMALTGLMYYVRLAGSRRTGCAARPSVLSVPLRSSSTETRCEEQQDHLGKDHRDGWTFPGTDQVITDDPRADCL